ncbi:MAG: copper amine oxidase [Pelosinus sp.]|nr:copper amine oxidase [Pelosinus sp.]
MKKPGVLFCSVLFALCITGTALAANLGQSDELDVDAARLPEWSMNSIEHNGTLLLSDSPEAVPDNGIMYEDIVSGDVRLFFHHVNATQEDKKIVVLMENADNKPAHVTIYQWGLGGPDYNYVQVGKDAQEAYMKGWDLTMFEVPQHGSAVLDERITRAILQPKMLVNGIYDFKTDRPVKVRVMMMPVDAQAEAFAATAAVLPNDQYRLRGTFKGKDRTLVSKRTYNPRKDGIVGLTLADDTVDKYVKGIDATDGTSVENYGNYGIVYKLYLPSEKTGKIAYYLTPLGGEYAGALGIKYSYILKNPVENPSDKLSLGAGEVQDASFVGVYDGGQSLWLTFSPPGASNLPVKLVIMPK